MPRDNFHQELREIEESVITMATLVESAIARAMQALTQRDADLAGVVIASDGEVNEMQRGIRSRCTNVIALQARANYRSTGHQRTRTYGRPCGRHRETGGAHP